MTKTLGGLYVLACCGFLVESSALTMPSPSFDEIGLPIDSFLNEHLYWWSPNVNVTISRQKDTGLLFSFLTNVANSTFEPYGAYSYYHRAFWTAEFFTFPLKDCKLAFKYCNPCVLYSTLTFPLFVKSLQQELFLSLPTSVNTGDSYDNSKIPNLRSRSSYLSENLRVDFATVNRGKKLKSSLSLVLR